MGGRKDKITYVPNDRHEGVERTTDVTFPAVFRCRCRHKWYNADIIRFIRWRDRFLSTVSRTWSFNLILLFIKTYRYSFQHCNESWNGEQCSNISRERNLQLATVFSYYSINTTAAQISRVTVIHGIWGAGQLSQCRLRYGVHNWGT
jgi:hypothetical protein